MLIIPDVDDFIEELVDSILESVDVEIEVTHLEGAIFESYNEEWIIPEEELRASIREVIERWMGEES